jgi:hypothetical protein
MKTHICKQTSKLDRSSLYCTSLVRLKIFVKMSPLILGTSDELKCYNLVIDSCQESCGKWRLVTSAFGTSRAKHLGREFYLYRKRLEKAASK